MSRESCLFENKSLDEIFSSFLLRNLYLRSAESGEFSNKELCNIIKKYGLSQDLILFHINEYCKLNESDELLKLFSLDKKNIGDYYHNLSTKNLHILLDYFSHNYTFNIEDREDIYIKNIFDFLYTFLTKEKCSKVFFKDLIKRFLIDSGIKDFIDDSFMVDIWSVWQTSELYGKEPEFMLDIACMLSGINYEKLYEKNNFENYKMNNIRYNEDYDNNTFLQNKASGFIAYKAVQNDYTSTMSSRYKFLPGQEYSSECDCDLHNINSFGLSAWDKKGALTYCSEKLLKVKINFEDLKFVDFYSGKVRATKITIIEEVNLDKK